jgi:hypothetical protein
VYVVHPSNNSLSTKTRQKNSKYNQANEIANGNTIFIPVGVDLYGKLGSETTKLIDSIAVIIPYMIWTYIYDIIEYYSR